MRLTFGFLAAVGLHGALFGLATVVLSHASVKAAAAAPAEVEVEIMPARPDPIADAAPTPAAPAATPKPVLARPRPSRQRREVAVVHDATPTPASVEPSADPDAPAIPPSPPAVAPPPEATESVRPGPTPAPSAGALLSAKPRYRTNPTPDYPIPSRRRREEGIVLLDVRVRADGTPATVSLNRSCGHPLLDQAALDAVRRWTFDPARAEGVPVTSLVVIPVRFSLSDGQ